MEVRTATESLQVSDGTVMNAYVARPASGESRRALILLQEAFGINAHIRDIAERFARQGYLTIAPELFHRTGPGFEGRYDDFQAAQPHMRALTDEGLEADLHAAFDWLRADHEGRSLAVSAIGFCLGGRVAYLAAIILPIACAVSFYGGGITPNPYSKGLLDRSSEMRAPILLFWGGRDQHLGVETRRAVADSLTGSGKSFTSVVFSDADHGFFCDARPSYNPKAASQAWPLTLAFLDTYQGA